jgi:4-hydroxy-2-oxoheptanedioate aldolase
MRNVRRAIADGEVVVGACCDVSDPSAVEALGYAGWDFVLINAEGGTIGPYGDELEQMIRAAHRADVTPAVKVPENEPAMIASALKLGANLIEVPMVSSRADAERALRAAHYPPDGERMACWGVPATRYGADDWPDHVAQAAEETLVYAVLEERAAVENLEEILSTPGLEAVILGELDLALRLGGVEDEDARERVEAYRDDLYRVADEEDVAVIDIVGTEAEAADAVDRGAAGLLYARDDLAMLREAAEAGLAALRSGAE